MNFHFSFDDKETGNKKEVRCPNCNKILFISKSGQAVVEIKCNKCKEITSHQLVHVNI